jgi:NADH-quinone oxidoreductase subunit F
VRRYNKLIVEGKFVEAWETIRERAPFPASLGRICHHPCEDRCQRGYFDEAIAIRSLKRHIADKALPEVKKRRREKKKLTGDKVAVIGAGPAGLSAALDLVRLGYRVTVFEKQKLPGGMLLMGVPKYRLPKEIL